MCPEAHPHAHVDEESFSASQDFLLPGRYKKFMPIPSAISIPFYIGTYIALDFCVGAAILLIWKLRAPESAAKYGIVTGAGLMVGDGIWQLPFGILGIAKVTQVRVIALSSTLQCCRVFSAKDGQTAQPIEQKSLVSSLRLCNVKGWQSSSAPYIDAAFEA